jgi:hypothetical protein
MAYRSKKRRSSRRQRSIQRNPLSPKQKLIAVGGIVAVGGVAAYMLTSGGSAPPPLPPGAGAAGARAAKEAECSAIQTSLLALRATATPDRTVVTQLEAQLATCLAQARELGVTVDPSTANLSTGDTTYQRIEAWWNEYRATSEHDPLKRNNIRQEILNAGAALAASYADAITQSTTTVATTAVAQSIVRALDAAIGRRICFLNNDRGCGTFGANEDQPDAKAAQEQDRVIAPLVAVYMQAVAKVGGPSRAIADADGEKFLAAMLRPCAFWKGYIDAQFAHYRATDWSDALKRNNTRQTILRSGRDLTACLQGVFSSASSFGSLTSLRAVGALTIAAINASIDRWACFLSNQSGCGTFAANEDQPDVKAQQERANTAVPLMALYTNVARALVSRGDVNAFEALVTAKLRVCTFLNDYVGAQFGHYKATDYSDALKRNNTRQTILAYGRDMVASLQDAYSTAIGGAAGSSMYAAAIASGINLLGSGMMLQFQPTSGLGQLMMLTSVPATATAILSSTTAASSSSAAVLRMVRAVATVVYTALDQAITRQLCFLYAQSGCGTFGANEDQPDAKAAQEQAATVTPLFALYEQIARFMKEQGDLSVVTKLAELKLRPCATAKSFIDGQFGHYKATEYSDALKRNNTRGTMLAVGGTLVACLQNALAMAIGMKNAQSVQLVANTIISSLDAAMVRRDCYFYDQPGCGRFGVNELHGNDKAADESRVTVQPLIALARQAVTYLAATNASAETPLMNLLLRSINAGKNFVDGKYGELKATDYSDSVRRNNIRDALIGAGQQMVAAFRNAKPTTSAGRTLVRSAAQAALTKSREREACYRAGASGCDRMWGVFVEPAGGDKANQEAAEIGNPLAALIADRSANGLGSFMDEGFAGISGYTWLGLGAVALVGVAAYQSSKKSTRRNKRRRRTSRRLRLTA